MAVAAQAESKSIPWYSWVALVAFVAGAVVLVFAVKRDVVPDVVRWTVTILWILVTVGLGIYDFFLMRGSTDPGPGGAIDVKPLDRWTVSHTGAGLVLGVWFVPLVWLVLLVVAWEAFEFFVPGFGETEILANRGVDILVAVIGWFVVVLISMAITGAPFPFI
jgi:hypothetical protein